MAKTTRKTNAKTTGSASGDEMKAKPTPAEAPAKKAAAKKAGVKKATAKKAAAKKAPAKKASGGKAVAKKAAAGQAAGAARKAPAGSNTSPPRVSSEQRHQMIEQAAYLRAESLGFCSDPKQDWLTAEAEVDARLAAAGITVSD